jgi:hypothetical protein
MFQVTPNTKCAVVLSFAAGICLTSVPASLHAQERPPLAPPLNHEVGRVAQVITATDAGNRFRAYLLDWRSMQIVVSGPPDDSHVVGNNLEILVYRTEVNGRKVLRVAPNVGSALDNEVDRESEASSAAITQGTAQIESSIAANSDGYQFVGYFVTWHGQRIFVVDPLSAPPRATGETINFRVFRSGSRLSFSL